MLLTDGACREGSERARLQDRAVWLSIWRRSTETPRHHDAGTIVPDRLDKTGARRVEAEDKDWSRALTTGDATSGRDPRGAVRVPPRPVRRLAAEYLFYTWWLANYVLLPAYRCPRFVCCSLFSHGITQCRIQITCNSTWHNATGLLSERTQCERFVYV